MKISAIVANLDVLRVRALGRADRRSTAPAVPARPAARRRATFVNLDMEEYRDLELTVAAFMRVLDEDEFARARRRHRAAGVPPRLAPRALERLGAWAIARRAARRRHDQGARRQGCQPGDGARRGRAARLDRGAVRIEGRGGRELQGARSSRPCDRTGRVPCGSASPATTSSTSPGRRAARRARRAATGSTSRCWRGWRRRRRGRSMPHAGRAAAVRAGRGRRRLRRQRRLPLAPPRREHRAGELPALAVHDLHPSRPDVRPAGARFRAAVERRRHVSTTRRRAAGPAALLDAGRAAFANEPDTDFTPTPPCELASADGAAQPAPSAAGASARPTTSTRSTWWSSGGRRSVGGPRHGRRAPPAWLHRRGRRDGRRAGGDDRR